VTFFQQPTRVKMCLVELLMLSHQIAFQDKKSSLMLPYLLTTSTHVWSRKLFADVLGSFLMRGAGIHGESRLFRIARRKLSRHSSFALHDHDPAHNTDSTIAMHTVLLMAILSGVRFPGLSVSFESFTPIRPKRASSAMFPAILGLEARNLVHTIACGTLPTAIILAGGYSESMTTWGMTPESAKRWRQFTKSGLSACRGTFSDHSRLPNNYENRAAALPAAERRVLVRFVLTCLGVNVHWSIFDSAELGRICSHWRNRVGLTFNDKLHPHVLESVAPRRSFLKARNISTYVVKEGDEFPAVYSPITISEYLHSDVDKVWLPELEESITRAYKTCVSSFDIQQSEMCDVYAAQTYKEFQDKDDRKR